MSRVRETGDADGARLIAQMRVANETLVLATMRAEESEATFRALFDAMPQLGWIARADGFIHFFNRGWYEYTGQTLAELEGWGWLAVHEQTSRATTEAHWRVCIESGTPFDLCIPLRRHDGVYRWFLTRANPERDRTGRVVRWVGINTDVDDQRRSEQQLAWYLERERHAHAEAEVLGQRKDEFLAMLAHELRNPLAALNTAHELMAQDGTTDPRALRLREISSRQIRHLVRLVDDLLDIARITRGKVELRHQRVELATVLDDALLMARAQMDSRGQVVSVRRDQGAFCVDGDSTRLEQIFTNLLVNAARYTGQGGRIEVRCRREQLGDTAWAVIDVEDTGQGLAPAMVERVFDLFTQVDGSSLERANGGLGIGLTLVRRLVELHGGSVEARSPGLDMGSTFTVRLPLLAAEARVSMSPIRTHVVRDASINPRLVVVEDNPDERETLKELLESWGHQVEAAADGAAGAEMILASAPDMAFVDVGLPGIDGFEVARRVRASPAHARTLLIALTGYGDADMRARTLAAGFDDHLIKPASTAVLTRVLATRSF